ncbi:MULTISPECIES: ectoine/hydroxyectoine ABC transporter substrate-binding protein EhuB [unclassified Mesorhizobium]|uniref:ectoine/hydroxyectoine ABC transporter substrate-binding protein EhuB n=1 Tax=unclassified Mesorhizobium TaxID=325217 RepID=UPI00192625C8|nr:MULTISPECIES: ectoine/hydroxyectoine ABC transporter substrate-binding protein EhuB [unclassified Mesorhizobium]BCG97366.1 ectoine/hydroxyectoine ABC transporter substrate-binding protein EhuB [Mesorhizobium sp. 131-2-1]BCH04437.1 ectoine/hydroxyectoine ABC transporter substrate-binding protein EhuB [Mesorhizobium sp. 131-2-5]
MGTRELHNKITWTPRLAIQRRIAALGIAVASIAAAACSAHAESLLDKIKKGETVRIGFSNEIPWAYPGENNAPLGFVNAMTIDLLKKLGTTKIEPVVAEWGSLIPGLQAGRYDIITGGMYITPERCRNVLFTEPLGNFSDALLVAKGNPKGIHSLTDILDKGLTLAAVAGSVYVKQAKQAGIADDKLMQVAGDPEVVQSIKAGRADAGTGAYFTSKRLVDNDKSIQMAEPFNAPEGKVYPGLVLSPDQQADVDALNAVMKTYLGSEEMLASVGKYGYTKSNLPDGTKTADLCKR